MQVEKLIMMRTKVLMFVALTFALWQLAWIAQDLFANKQSLYFQIAGWSTVVGAIMYVVAAYFLYRYSVAVKKAKACRVLNDELSLQNRNKAFMFGYFFIFAVIWLLIPLTDIVALDLKLAIRTVATFAVVVPILYFVYLESQGEAEED